MAEETRKQIGVKLPPALLTKLDAEVKRRREIGAVKDRTDAIEQGIRLWLAEDQEDIDAWRDGTRLEPGLRTGPRRPPGWSGSVDAVVDARRHGEVTPLFGGKVKT